MLRIVQCLARVGRCPYALSMSNGAARGKDNGKCFSSGVLGGDKGTKGQGEGSGAQSEAWKSVAVVYAAVLAGVGGGGQHRKEGSGTAGQAGGAAKWV